MITLVAMLRRRSGMSQSEFLEHWFERHGPLMRDTPALARHLLRYEQYPRGGAEWMGTASVDGVAVQCFADVAAFEAFLAEPDYAALVAPDEEAFLDRESIVWFVGGEPNVVIGTAGG